ncbi:MAG TPA: acetate/propionate family kinase [Acidimicrobiia bacterium]
MGERMTSMRVLVVNAGSSSLKVRVLGAGDEVEAEHDVDRWDPVGETEELAAVLGSMPACEAVGHRIVHGGNRFREAVRVDGAVEHELLSLATLAPLHQPRAVAGIRMMARLHPELPQVACFDTAFHAAMPAAAATYALPRDWRERWGLRRFGFHGLSHAYASRRAAEVVDRVGDPELRVVSCHLGAGASLCATRGGRSVDTTMGWTPLEGLVMATRSGTIDPGLVLWLLEHGGLAVDEVATALESDSGLAGLSGIPGGDLREVLAARVSGDGAAVLAVDVYVHRLRRELGAMIAVLGGLDVLVFTGGVGEHSPEIRAAACDALAFAGVGLDADRNASTHDDGEIGAFGASVRSLVVTAREDVEIARQVRALIAKPS